VSGVCLPRIGWRL